jgi:excisionase family DNA binding protein
MFIKKLPGGLDPKDQAASACGNPQNQLGIFSGCLSGPEKTEAAVGMPPGECLGKSRILLTIRETASLLRVSESTVRNAIRSGQLKAFRFGTRGGSIRIAPADLDDYTASCSTAATPRLPQKSSGRSKGTPFKSLDGAKLLAAWRRQGVFGDQKDSIPLPQ